MFVRVSLLGWGPALERAISIRYSLSVAVTVFIILGVCDSLSRAQETVTSDQLLKSLLPQSGTRGLNLGSSEQESSRRELELKLQGLKTRRIDVQERDQVANLLKKSEAPAVDIEIFFAFDSADITPEALPKLAALGQALSDKKLQHSIFLIAGHTDAKGSDAYNLALSQQRAEAVKQFLVRAYQLDSNHLSVIGFGSEQLKNKTDSFADENRRVQIVNVSSEGN
jgi:outer membrane protein OmpA-like peptidoglycan-associated protein